MTLWTSCSVVLGMLNTWLKHQYWWCFQRMTLLRKQCEGFIICPKREDSTSWSVWRLLHEGKIVDMTTFFWAAVGVAHWIHWKLSVVVCKALKGLDLSIYSDLNVLITFVLSMCEQIAMWHEKWHLPRLSWLPNKPTAWCLNGHYEILEKKFKLQFLIFTYLWNY